MGDESWHKRFGDAASFGLVCTGSAKNDFMRREPVLLLCRFCLAIFIVALWAQGCGVHRPAWDPQQQAAIAQQKEEVVNRLIPEDGLTFTRRTRLIDATIFVLREGDREELQNLANLRGTLRAASLENLKEIETNYKERIADGE